MSKSSSMIYELACESDKSILMIKLQLEKLEHSKSTSFASHKSDLYKLQLQISNLHERQKKLIKHLMRSDKLKNEIDQHIILEFELGRKFVPTSLLSSINRISNILAKTI